MLQNCTLDLWLVFSLLCCVLFDTGFLNIVQFLVLFELSFLLRFMSPGTIIINFPLLQGCKVIILSFLMIALKSVIHIGILNTLELIVVCGWDGLGWNFMPPPHHGKPVFQHWLLNSPVYSLLCDATSFLWQSAFYKKWKAFVIDIQWAFVKDVVNLSWGTHQDVELIQRKIQELILWSFSWVWSQTRVRRSC